jgi:predicted nucleic acid-binding Zn ribbon protein
MRADPRLHAYRSYQTRQRWARGPHRPSAPAPTRSADLVTEVLGRLGGAGRALEFRVFDCFSRVVGDALRTRTMPERLAGTTLFVRATSSALAHELTLLRAEILERMAAEMGQGIVLEIRTRVGRIPTPAT